MSSKTNTQGAIEHVKTVLHSIIKRIKDAMSTDTHASLANDMIDSIHNMRDYSRAGAYNLPLALSILETAREIGERTGDTDLQITAELASLEVQATHAAHAQPTPQLIAV